MNRYFLWSFRLNKISDPRLLDYNCIPAQTFPTQQSDSTARNDHLAVHSLLLPNANMDIELSFCIHAVDCQ